MNRILVILAILLSSACSDVRSAEINEKDTMRKEFRFADPKADNRVSVDNVIGSISATGYQGDLVELTVHKAIRARSPEKLEKAKSAVSLDISEENDALEFYVTGPFRKRDGSVNYHGWRATGYEVTFDFELRVPDNTKLVLKTINDGEINVKNFRGDYELDNINGGIEMADVSGSGHVHTINGDLTIRFKNNPLENSFFGSLNGAIKLYFQSPLTADFRIKTFNGEAYSDFEVTHIPPKSFTTIERNGKKIYKSDKTFGVRAGKGGPEIELDAFNGDIYLFNKDRK
ncbi:hypothetical protein JXJ21_04160 [candidate division KSB1 bacterium]|nr:hypothetical protein [candidate division KSB1 bacterium]